MKDSYDHPVNAGGIVVVRFAARRKFAPLRFTGAIAILGSLRQPGTVGTDCDRIALGHGLDDQPSPAVRPILQKGRDSGLDGTRRPDPDAS